MIKFRYKRKENAQNSQQTLQTIADATKNASKVQKPVFLKRANSSSDILDSIQREPYIECDNFKTSSCINAIIVRNFFSFNNIRIFLKKNRC
jgi:hypothetical protein